MKPAQLLGKRSLFAGGFALCVGLTLFAVREVMLPFVLAMVLAYVLTPLVSMLEARRIKRGWAIVLLYAVFIGTLVLAVRGAMPRVLQEGGALARDLPGMLHNVEQKVTPPLRELLARAGVSSAESDDSSFVRELALEKLREHAATGAKGAFVLVKSLISGSIGFVFVFTLTLMLAAYMVLTRERIMGFLRRFATPASRPSFDRLLVRLDRGLGGVVRGQLMICGINGALTTIGFATMGLRYWPVFGLIATVFSLIPVFGTIASSVPAVLVGLSQSPQLGLMVLLWIIAIHQLEANFLNPKIMGHAAEIHPVLVMFALLAGEHLFGIVGALLGVPCMSLAQSLFLHARAEWFGADLSEESGGKESAVARPARSD